MAGNSGKIKNNCKLALAFFSGRWYTRKAVHRSVENAPYASKFID
jgi:hypothetical protein